MVEKLKSADQRREFFRGVTLHARDCFDQSAFSAHL
jgi:hypothetical protein